MEMHVMKLTEIMQRLFDQSHTPYMIHYTSHEFHETCHCITFIVMVNSSLVWIDSGVVVSQHRLESFFHVMEWQVSWNSCSAVKHGLWWGMWHGKAASHEKWCQSPVHSKGRPCPKSALFSPALSCHLLLWLGKLASVWYSCTYSLSPVCPT